ncbi:MAG: hypothetical protein ACKOET_16260 [Verrucomicrobiota bacterium]
MNAELKSTEPTREEVLFAAPPGLPPAERTGFPDGTCPGTQTLRHLLEDLHADDDATITP